MPETDRPDNSHAHKNDITDNSAEFEFDAISVIEAAPVNYAGRIKVLMAAIIVATIAYTGAWFWVASYIVKTTQTAISDAAKKGQTVTCDQAAAIGYPFRMGLTCSKTGFTDPAQNLKIEAGAFRSAAQIYQPRHIIGELDGPLKFTANNINPLTANWALAHASYSGNGGLPARVSLEIEKPVVTETTTQIGIATLAAFHMRLGENNQVDLASNIDAIQIKDAPAFNFSSDASVSGATRFDAALDSGKPLMDVLRGNQGELRNITLAFTDGGSVTISGPFSWSDAGLLSGTFSVKAGQTAALIDNLSKVTTALGSPVNNLDTVKAMAINDAFDLTITVKDGNASLGFIPLGKISAL